VRLLRNHPAGQQSRARVATNHGTGKALTGRAQTWARAVDDLVTRATVGAMDNFCHESRRGARAPDASRDAEGISLRTGLWQGGVAASLHAHAHRGLPP
jgi:hypothetical protein